jgi:hypothetical protein
MTNQELDRLMAEVMGWTIHLEDVVVKWGSHPDEDVIEQHEICRDAAGKFATGLGEWRPTEKVGQAMMVLQVIRKMPMEHRGLFMVKLHAQDHGTDSEWLSFGYWLMLEADIPLVICRAVAEAVGKEGKG